MWFSLFAAALILAITFFQGLQGLFTSVIMCILTVMSAALAFGLYEDLYFSFLVEYQPDHGRAIALMAIFILTLLVLRAIFEVLISGNMQFPVYVDRIGGGVFGFVTAMVIIGTLATGFQMLPFPTTFLGFTRYTLIDKDADQPIVNPTKDNQKDEDVTLRDRIDSWENTERRRNNLWFKPDGFTVALVSHLSHNSLRGRNRHSFGEVYPDFAGHLHWIRDGLYRESLDATGGANPIRVKGYWYLPEKQQLYTLKRTEGSKKTQKIELIPYDDKLDSDHRRLAIRVVVTEQTQRATYPKNLHFTTMQVRLLGQERRGAALKEYFLAGMSEEQNPGLYVKLFAAQDIQRPRDSVKGGVDFVFEVPADDEFTPVFVEYKQNARAAIRSAHRFEEPPGPIGLTEDDDTEHNSSEPPDEDDSPPGPPGSGRTPGRPSAGDDDRPPGRVHGVNIADREPVFSDRLPFKLTQYSENDLELSGGALLGGRIMAQLDSDWQPRPGRQAAIETFDVPEDVRLLQLSCDKLHPQSWLGGISGGMKDKLRNIYLIDDGGKEYMPVGSYAIAKVGGRPIFQLIYLDETARGFARLPEFSRIKTRDLKGEYTYVFLFHLPPGTRAVELNTGNKRLHLRRFDLVAPR